MMAGDFVLEMRTNLPAFKEQLRALGAKLEKQAVRKAASAAARVLRDEVKRNAPVLQPNTQAGKKVIRGALKANVRFARSKFQVAGAYRAFVNVRSGKKSKGDPFYWKFLEGGWIPRGRGHALKGGNKSRALQRERLLKAGAKQIKRPFVAPAFSAKGAQALAAFYESLSKFIAQQQGGRA